MNNLVDLTVDGSEKPFQPTKLHATAGRSSGDNNSNTDDGTYVLLCQKCRKQAAEIFQVTGDFCLQCWQMATHPDVAPGRSFLMPS
jgi:hypothetical protein